MPLITEVKCKACGKEEGDIRRCAKCQLAFYCSKACQEQDWAKHKPECVRSSKTADRLDKAERDLVIANIDSIWLARVPDEHEDHSMLFFPTARRALVAVIEETGFYPIRHVTKIKDRYGKETFIHFYVPFDMPMPYFHWGELVPGNVICVFDPVMHSFLDGTYGIRIDNAQDIRIYSQSD